MPSAQLGLRSAPCCVLGAFPPHIPTEGSSDPPLVGHHRHPPALDLAELGVRNVDLQGQARHPHGDLQGSAQVLVGEVHQGVHLALHLLAVDKNVVTPVRDLRGGDKVITDRAAQPHTDKAPFSFTEGAEHTIPPWLSCAGDAQILDAVMKLIFHL